MNPNILSQLQRFQTGFPYLKIIGAATVGHGILRLSDAEEIAAINRWQAYLSHGGQVTKFVPASGAASRMFKALYAYVNSPQTPNKDVQELLAHIDLLPFKDDLEQAVQRLFGQSITQLHDAGRDQDIINAIILEDGLNYGHLPKALIKFHTYPTGSRTPLEEHLTEGAQTAADDKGVVNLHFTVSSNHRQLFEQALQQDVAEAEKRTGLKFHVTISEQKPETDTIAVNPDNTPFLVNGKPLMRPGGHGALIENLNDIPTAVVMVKNIDNVVPDNHRTDTIRYKQVLGGVLLQIHDKIEEFLITLEEQLYTPDSLEKMLAFIREVLCTSVPEMDPSEWPAWIKSKLDRPLRVCGMVKNEGEPGGGPYIAVNPDGTASLQILESNQIDPNNTQYKAMVASATHFNPVDLALYIHDIHNKPYNLPDYVDPETGFISSKSSDGKELKALELPGLWNGAMSDWNTVFIEVPISTFNPVKTVNDLLRPMHQA